MTYKHTYIRYFHYSLLYSLPNGAEYLFLSDDEGGVHAWITCINSAIQTGMYFHDQTMYGLDLHNAII